MADEKKLKRILWVSAGLLDVPLRRIACQLAQKIPSDHWIRSATGKTFLGIINAAVEAHAVDLNPIAAVALEKLTDLGNFLSGALGAEESKVGGWVSEFRKRAEKKLLESEKPEETLEELMKKFQILLQLREFLAGYEEEGKKIVQLEKVGEVISKKFQEGYKKMNSILENVNKNSRKWRLI